MSITKQILAQNASPFPDAVIRSAAGKRVIAQHFWNSGLMKFMPQHFKDYHQKWMAGPRQHIHSIPNTARFEKDEWGEIYPVQNPRVHVVYPDQFHTGLWGGEGVIKGLLKRPDGNHRNFTPPAAKYWWPRLFEGVAYSEILDAHIDLVCTKRGLRLVDESKGFDFYLLDTPVNEIYAKGMLRIKRELLLALADKDQFSTRLGGKPEVYDKYQKFAVSFEEADWHGLSLAEALKKQAKILALEAEKSVQPDKIKYRQQLIEDLRSGRVDDLKMMDIDSESAADQTWLQNKLKGVKRIFT